MSLRIVFMGTPQFAVPTFEAVAAAHDVVAAYTQPPRKAGRRGLETVPSRVHRAAQQRAIAVRHPLSLKDEQEQAAFAALGADVAVVVAYGLILPRPVLDAPRLGCINGHASLLPRWRGAAPVQRAIMAGDAHSGVCIMQMEAGLDTGPVLLERRLAIRADETAGELHERLAALTADAMVAALGRLEAGTATAVPQPDEGVEYAAKIDKAEARVDWERPADAIARTVRGLSPFPGAWTVLGGERVKLLGAVAVDGSGEPGTVLATREGIDVAAGSGAVRLTRLQKAGGKALDAAAFLNGTPLAKGDRFGD